MVGTIAMIVIVVQFNVREWVVTKSVHKNTSFVNCNPWFNVSTCYIKQCRHSTHRFIRRSVYFQLQIVIKLHQLIWQCFSFFNVYYFCFLCFHLWQLFMRMAINVCFSSIKWSLEIAKKSGLLFYIKEIFTKYL